MLFRSSSVEFMVFNYSYAPVTSPVPWYDPWVSCTIREVAGPMVFVEDESAKIHLCPKPKRGFKAIRARGLNQRPMVPSPLCRHGPLCRRSR